MGSKTVNEVYCICRSSSIDTFMICCDFCQEWFHGDCIGVSEESAKNIELYYCKSCLSLHPNLRITHKTVRSAKRKITSKKCKNSKTRIKYTPSKTKFQEEIEVIVVTPSNSTNSNSIPSDGINVVKPTTVEIPSTDTRTANDEALAHIFESDTSNRKAKTVANQIIKDHVETSTASMAKQAEHAFKQCDGPGCCKVARINSKYCSDKCGINLGTNRILEILPQRLNQKKVLPSSADELSRTKLAAVRRKQRQIHLNIEQIDIQIMQLLQLAHKSKNSKEDSVIQDDFEEDNSMLDCKLCGAEVATRMLVKHMEHCFRKHGRSLLLTGGDATTKPDDLEWNIFCNHKMGKQGYCKHLKVLCPLHRKEPPSGNKNDDEVCGYPFQMNLAECCGKFCGRPRKSCLEHPRNWEDNFRADLDMRKLQLLLKLSELEKEEMALRKDMAARGNLMALMLHQTIVH